MGIMNERKHLQGKQVKVFCDDGECLEGFWSEWFDADEIDWDEGKNLMLQYSFGRNKRLLGTIC